MQLYTTLTFLPLFLLISCQHNEFPEERMFEPIELVGRYCGTDRNTNEFREEFSVEIVSHDTLLLLGNFDNILMDIKCFIRNDSLIFPRQIRYWTNQSPGGATWEEWEDYQGTGVFYPGEKMIDIDIVRNKEMGDMGSLLFQYTLLSEPDFDMSGIYSSIGASADSARIMELGDGDSVEISLNLDSQNFTDSLIRNFRIENPKCEDKRIYINMDTGLLYPHYRLEGSIHLAEDSAIIEFDTLVWVTSGAMTHRGPYYHFTGVKIN